MTEGKERLAQTAAAQLNGGENDAGLATLNRAVSLYPNEGGFYFGLAIAYARSGAIIDARRAVEKALTLNPSHRKSRVLQIELAGSAEAEKVKREEAAGEGPEFFDAAIAALEREDGPAVLDLCHRIKALKNSVPKLDYIRAMGFVLIGDLPCAKAALETELSSSPECREAQTLLRQVIQELEMNKGKQAGS